MLKGTLIGIAVIVGFIVVILAAAVIALIRALDKSGNSPSPPPRAQLIPVGQPAEIGDGWRLKVLRVTPTAEREARVAEKAPDPGRRPARR